MSHFVNEWRYHKPCESLNGIWKIRTHSRARGDCHVSTSSGRGVTILLVSEHLVSKLSLSRFLTVVVDKEVTSTNSFIEGGYDSEGGDT